MSDVDRVEVALKQIRQVPEGYSLEDVREMFGLGERIPNIRLTFQEKNLESLWLISFCRSARATRRPFRLLTACCILPSAD